MFVSSVRRALDGEWRYNQVKGVPAPPKRVEPELVANFLPVKFRGSAFRAGVVPFSSGEQVASLREELKGTHVVRRDGDRVAGDQRGALAALHVYPEYKLDSRVSVLPRSRASSWG